MHDNEFIAKIQLAKIKQQEPPPVVGSANAHQIMDKILADAILMDELIHEFVRRRESEK